MKKIIFIFLLMIFIIPFEVSAETFYLNYSDWIYSLEPIEKGPTKMVSTEIIEGIKYYKYQTRDYITFPNKLIITSMDFNVLETIETNLDKSQIEITYIGELEEFNHSTIEMKITYKDTIMFKTVYVEIPDYINVPPEILVEDNEFDIWKYIETNVNKEEIEIYGDYDINVNGTYEVIIIYKDIEKKTNIIVENSSIEEVSKEDEVLDKDSSSNKENILMYETTNNCVNNYYTYNTTKEEIKECSCKEIKPIDKTIYNTKYIDNSLFQYITYAFYVLVFIELSIIVVRKK